jgi:hypothetical protein
MLLMTCLARAVDFTNASVTPIRKDCINLDKGREMRVKWHFVASLAIAIVSLFFNQNVPFLVVEFFGYTITVFILCIVAGVLVDIDHVVDIRLNKEHFFESNEAKYRDGRWFVIFHGIETVAVLCGLSILFPFLLFPTASYICHMVMDFYANGVSFQAYFYMVRFGRMFIHRSMHSHTI